jgi:mono/diheme cytochrome c family protein
MMINSLKDRMIATLILLSVTATAQAAPFAKGDAAAGKKLFDQHKCNSCHASMLGGDGSAMFTRAERKVKTAASLATQITRCSVNLGLTLFPEDEESIGAYLNRNYYKFK